MRALVQRIRKASVETGGKTIGQSGPGLLIFICAMAGDHERDAERMAAKTARLRIFADEAGRMNKSLLDIRGSALVVSQFTLAADTSRGNRPGFTAAAPPDVGRRLYTHFAQALSALGPHVETGEFGADMQVELINDGPVTLWLDTAA